MIIKSCFTRIVALIILIIFPSCMGKTKNSYNSESDIDYSPDFIQYAEDLTEYSEQLTSYAYELTYYSDDLTSYANNLTYLYFGEYADGIYSVQLQSQEYIKTYLEINGIHAIDLEKIMAQLCIGTGTILITAFVLPALPVFAGVQTLKIAEYATKVCVMAVKISSDAIIGSALDAAITGTIKYYETNGDIEQTFYSAIEESAEGFMWGAVISSSIETLKEVKIVHQKKEIADVYQLELKNTHKSLPQKTINSIVKENTDDLFSILKQVPENKKELIYRFFASYPDDAANLYAKYQDEILTVFEKIGKTHESNLLKILKSNNCDDFIDLIKNIQNQKWADNALNALIKFSDNKPEDFATIIDWVKTKGEDGIFDIIKWNGVTPKWLNKQTIEVAKQISGSYLKKSSEQLLKLPSIKLSIKELDKIRQNPFFLDEIVKKYTGKPFSDGYIEFFVRLSKQNPNQVEAIWNYSKTIRDFIKNNGIRSGGVHEWLLCENFCDFLTNPKWRKDGAYLCNLLSNLTQPTDSVVMETSVTLVLKDGTKETYPFWSHYLESTNTFGNPSNPNSIIHNSIRNIIEKSNNTEELIFNLDNMIKENFSTYTYEEFSKALNKCLL